MGTALDEAESLLLTGGVQVIEEDPSYTPGLSSVTDVEVSVAPGQQQNWIRKSFCFPVTLSVNGRKQWRAQLLMARSVSTNSEGLIYHKIV